ncbi:MAG: replication restart helicase PriA [Bacteroidia bacterium]
MWAKVWVTYPALQALYYEVGEEVRPGCRIEVPLGKRNTPYLGLVMEVGERDLSIPLKPYHRLWDAEPVYTPLQLEFFSWFSFYYMAAAGDMARAILPAPLRPDRHWWVRLLRPIPAKRGKGIEIASFLCGEPIAIHKLAKQVGVSPSKLLQRLNQWERAGYVRLEPRLVSRAYRIPKILRVAPAYQDAQAFNEKVLTLPSEVGSLWMQILQATLSQRPLSFSQVKKLAPAALRQLYRQGLVEILPAESYFQEAYGRSAPALTLTSEQQRAVQEILSYGTRPVLLHGVTASGKTFVYIEVMRHYLRQGKQVLYMLPEIALTKQATDKLKSILGGRVGIYHSNLSDAARARLWEEVRTEKIDIVIGVRSALFLPFPRLGLIVVDEEHEPSYHQMQRAPYYHARDAAVYYAHLMQIPLVLGSATPSVESYTHAQKGKYALVQLLQKALPTREPHIRVIDMRHQIRHQLSQGVFSDVLLELLQEKVAKGEQAILFRNRRGYASFIQCQACGTIAKCSQCDIHLTYHKSGQKLVCHYCGYRRGYMPVCEVCGSDKLLHAGAGTEKIELQLQQLLPHLRIARLDRDALQKKWQLYELIHAFEEHQYDVLIGTQMVTKGLDFERVTLVGVLYAEQLMGFPDYRAEEKAYQLLIQLMGRAGRRQKESTLLIQTYQPQNPLFTYLDKPYTLFYEHLLAQRERYNYPPFTRLIQIELRHKERLPLESQAAFWAQKLIQAGIPYLGPEYAPIALLGGLFRMHILLKLPPSYAYKPLRLWLSQTYKHFKATFSSHAAIMTFHVDI